MDTITIDLKEGSELAQDLDNLVELQRILQFTEKSYRQLKKRLHKQAGPEAVKKYLGEKTGYLLTTTTVRTTRYKSVVEDMQKAGSASPATVKKAKDRHSSEHERTTLRKRKPKTYLTDRQKRNMARRVMSGELTQAEASRRYDVSETTVSNLMKKARKSA